MASQSRGNAGETPPFPTDNLIPTLYEALRRLAHEKMGAERPGQTLQATALVHEAYLRLYADGSGAWNTPAHFYCAAAEAMRRILVERARRRNRLRHGAGLARVSIADTDIAAPDRAPELLAMDAALDRLERIDRRKSDIVKLRYFAGFTIAEAADLLGVSPTTVKADWSYARAWLQKSIDETLHG